MEAVASACRLRTMAGRDLSFLTPTALCAAAHAACKTGRVYVRVELVLLLSSRQQHWQPSPPCVHPWVQQLPARGGGLTVFRMRQGAGYRRTTGRPDRARGHLPFEAQLGANLTAKKAEALGAGAA